MAGAPTASPAIPMAVVLLQCTFLAAAILDPVDFLALQSIRRALRDSPGSTFFSSWDFTSDPCNFSGVLCYDSRVVALNLGDQTAGSPGLSGRIDPSVGRLASLAEFTLVPGRVSGGLPDAISELTGLRFVGISRNFISGEIPPGLAGLRSLQTLDLSYNQLNGSIPWTAGALPSLSNLILCHNLLSGPVPPFVSQTLTRIDLSHNDLSGSLPPYALPPSLQYLSLSANRLSGPVDRILPRLKRASHIDLSVNRFTGTIPAAVFAFPISELLLQRNAFSGWVRPEAPARIGTVDLSYNRLSGEISPFLAGIRSLYLNNNGFAGEVPGGFVEQLEAAGIQTLYLQHNFLTGVEISPTAEIPLTTSFCLQYNCMVPPLQAACPLKSGQQKRRPVEQCTRRRGIDVNSPNKK